MQTQAAQTAASNWQAFMSGSGAPPKPLTGTSTAARRRRLNGTSTAARRRRLSLASSRLQDAQALALDQARNRVSRISQDFGAEAKSTVQANGEYLAALCDCAESGAQLSWADQYVADHWREAAGSMALVGLS